LPQPSFYIAVPKGFLPLQDTGLITAVTEAGTDVSFTEMQHRQRLVEDAIRADADVTVSYRSSASARSMPRPTPADSPSPSARNDRSARVDEIVARLKHAVAGVAGMTVISRPRRTSRFRLA
jgi:multidrug efflux pump